MLPEVTELAKGKPEFEPRKAARTPQPLSNPGILTHHTQLPQACNTPQNVVSRGCMIFPYMDKVISYPQLWNNEVVSDVFPIQMS